ncbi:hypothetical protein NE865_04693 [Phthorimaea operculella]|nr:hypothetical protein NE865_04693 [Phthorimaea operculella]
MTFCRKRTTIRGDYILSDTRLESVGEIRDLGLTLDKNLDFRSHMTDICKKANKTLGFIMRTASQLKSVKVAIVLYNAYVRSKLEYGAVVSLREQIHSYDREDPEKVCKMGLQALVRILPLYVSFNFCVGHGFHGYFRAKEEYYPYMYPSIFVSGMVSMDTLELRRKMLLIAHYVALLRNKVNNSDTLSKIGLVVPKRGTTFGGVTLPPRRRERLFARVVSRTKRSANAPTARALAVLGDLLIRNGNADIFYDSLAALARVTYDYLNGIRHFSMEPGIPNIKIQTKSVL